MKTLVSKNALNRMALCVCFLSAHPVAQAIAQGAEPITIPMTADHWQTKENAEFLRQLAFYQGLMRLNSGVRHSKASRSATERSSSTSI